MNENQTQNAAQNTYDEQNQKVKPQMPQMKNYVGLNNFLARLNGNGGSQGAQQDVQRQNGPDVVAAQEEYKSISDGDAYTDENGNEWQWNVIEYQVVPEDVKDEMVDTLEENEEVEAEETVATDEADKIVLEAILGPLGLMSVVEDGYKDARPLTRKQEGFTTKNPNEISATAFKRGNVTVNGQKVTAPVEGEDVEYSVASYMVPDDKKAKENARLSHRKLVAATWEDCKAKDKARCPFHGAAYMTDKLGEILAKHGVTGGKYGIIMHDSGTTDDGKKNISYRLMFSVPKGSPTELRQQIAKDFLTHNPSIVFGKITSGFTNRFDSKTQFEINPEDIDDRPEDAPTEEDYLSRQDTEKQASYGEKGRARGAISWASVDTLTGQRFWNMLSERPTNIVECNEDFFRYAKEFPEYLPEGMTLDKVKEAYYRFKAANENKKGLSAFLLSGQMVDKAQALETAAERGLQKEYQEYLDASENVYNMAEDVFNSIQYALQGQFRTLQKDASHFADGNKVAGYSEEGEPSVYIGSKYKSTKGYFPMRNLGPYEEPMEDIVRAYKDTYDSTVRNLNEIQDGCEQREPLLISFDLSRMQLQLKALGKASEVLEQAQNQIIEDKDPRWRKKHGFVLNDDYKEDPAESKSEEEVKVAEVKRTDKVEATKKEESGKPTEEPSRKDKTQIITKKSEEKKIPPLEGTASENIKKIELPDSPTLEDAKKINDAFSKIERRLRGLTNVFNNTTKNSVDNKDAEADLLGAKAELENLMMSARGKGYSWTKDMTKYFEGEGDQRPFDVPKNFHISAITDASGKRVEVPYDEPKAGDMDIPKSREPEAKQEWSKSARTPVGEKPTKAEEEKEGTSKESPSKEPKKPAKNDYTKDFKSIDKKVGKIGSIYKDKTIADLIEDDGFEVREIPLKDGTSEYLLGKPDSSSRTGIMMKSDTTPPIRLSSVFEKRMKGKPSNQDALREFAYALMWKVEKNKADKAFEQELFKDLI